MSTSEPRADAPYPGLLRIALRAHIAILTTPQVIGFFAPIVVGLGLVGSDGGPPGARLQQLWPLLSALVALSWLGTAAWATRHALRRRGEPAQWQLGVLVCLSLLAAMLAAVQPTQPEPMDRSLVALVRELVSTLYLVWIAVLARMLGPRRTAATLAIVLSVGAALAGTLVALALGDVEPGPIMLLGPLAATLTTIAAWAVTALSLRGAWVAAPSRADTAVFE